MKNNKINIGKLKIESFVTELNKDVSNKTNHLRGGSIYGGVSGLARCHMTV